MAWLVNHLDDRFPLASQDAKVSWLAFLCISGCYSGVTLGFFGSFRIL